MWLIAASLMLAQPDRPQSPADAMVQAATDARRLPAEIGPYIRWLSLHNHSAADRVKATAVLNGHCNSLSRDPFIKKLEPVVGTSGAMLRLNLKDYRWSRELWEKLNDPYFSQTVQEYEIVTLFPALKVGDQWHGGPWKDGKVYPAGSFWVKTDWPAITEKRLKNNRIQAVAPWLTGTPEAKAATEYLVGWTGSRSPVVRADWFFFQGAASVDRGVGYYDFLNLKDEKDFQRLCGVDVALAEERQSVHREAVAVSGVTLRARGILRLGAIDSGYHKTLDFADNAEDKNPLRILGKDVERKYDASEQIGALPNGLLGYFLGNNKGEKQDTAPDKIASDATSHNNDRRVHVHVSCVRCHSDGGLQSVDGWVKNLLVPPLNLLSLDYEKYRELSREYARDLQAKIKSDRAAYEVAIKEATGLDSKTYSAGYGATFKRYDDPVGLDEAAAELGATKEQFRKALDARIKANIGSTVLSVLVLPNPRINRVPRNVWEEEFPNAQLILRGFVQP